MKESPGLPDLPRLPLVVYAEALFPMAGDGEARYLLAWGLDKFGDRWGFLLWPPQTLVAGDGVRHRGHGRWEHWHEIRPIVGEDYDGVPYR